MSFQLNPIGAVHAGESGYFIELEPEYKEGLKGLEGFGYVQILWCFDGCDSAASRSRLLEKKPYTKGPEVLGVFATRSPERPNPIGLTSCYVTDLDCENGRLWLAWIDANDGTPVLDIKPYTPAADRVEHPAVPDWCAHWPASEEKSGDFDWSAEFNF
ncbi:MAG: TrmO family methyltransferase [Oscillospiraceae bacterium]|nr:TrmO family methyltransferase [Oscillospiraceae bacterium]